MTGTLNLLSGLTIDKAYFDAFGTALNIVTQDGKLITIQSYSDTYGCDLNITMEDNDSTVLLDINA